MVDARIQSAVYKALARWKLKKMYRECGASSALDGPQARLVVMQIEKEIKVTSQNWYRAAAGLDESNSK